MEPTALSSGSTTSGHTEETVTVRAEAPPKDPITTTDCPLMDNSHVKVDPASGIKYFDNIVHVMTNGPLNAAQKSEILQVAGATSILCLSERPAGDHPYPPFGRYTLAFTDAQNLVSLGGAAQRLLGLKTYVTASAPDILNLSRLD